MLLPESASLAPALLAQTPIAYYTFNGNANDQTGNGNNGTIQGNSAFDPGGGITLYGDNALYYSGGRKGIATRLF